jgi:hypothetical protein
VWRFRDRRRVICEGVMGLGGKFGGMEGVYEGRWNLVFGLGACYLFTSGTFSPSSYGII